MFTFQEKIPLKDITLFCRQFGAMVQAGISGSRALEICTTQCVNKRLKMHLNHIHREVIHGCTLSDAIFQERIFPELLVHMIECGEVSGRLEQVLKQITVYFDNQLSIKKRLKKALLYPALVLITLIVVMIILMLKVVPSFMILLNETGAEVPRTTQIVMRLSRFIISYWPLLLFGSVLIISIGYLFSKTTQGKQLRDQLLLILPIVGRLNRKSIASNFANTLAMLVSSGVPMLQAMEMTKQVVNHSVASKALDHAMIRLKQGSSLYDALQESSIYPPILMSMVSIGEETGALDEMLIKMSAYFKEEVESAVDNLLVLIEPVLTIVMAILVGGLMLAVVQPTFSAATAVM